MRNMILNFCSVSLKNSTYSWLGPNTLEQPTDETSKKLTAIKSDFPAPSYLEELDDPECVYDLFELKAKVESGQVDSVLSLYLHVTDLVENTHITGPKR